MRDLDYLIHTLGCGFRKGLGYCTCGAWKSDQKPKPAPVDLDKLKAKMTGS